MENNPTTATVMVTVKYRPRSGYPADFGRVLDAAFWRRALEQRPAYKDPMLTVVSVVPAPANPLLVTPPGPHPAEVADRDPLAHTACGSPDQAAVPPPAPKGRKGAKS